MADAHDWSNPSEALARNRVQNEAAENLTTLPPDVPYAVARDALLAEIAAGSVGGAAGGVETLLDVVGAYEAIDDGGLVGDGTTDDRGALHTLANTTLSGGGTIVFRAGTYKIGSALTLPANVRLVFERGATLKPDSGVTVVIRGALSAGRYQIFDISSGGTFDLHNSGAAAGQNQRPNYVDGSIYPEWWGALGDSTTDDTTALLAAWDAATMDNHSGGDPTTGRAWSVGILDLAPGANYVFKKPLRILANTGIAVRGGGVQNTTLSWGHVPTRHVVTANPANNQLTLSAASTEAEIASGKMYFVCATGPAGWPGSILRILSQSGSTITLDGDVNGAVYGLTYGAGIEGYIAYDACLDFNGVFHINADGFTVSGAAHNGSWAVTGVHYHRVAAETAAGSSRGQFGRIEVSQCYARAGLALGALIRGSDASWAGYQEDMTLGVGIVINGFYSGLTVEQKNYLYQRGISDGTGRVANCLNHTHLGCAAYDNKYNYYINATNAVIYGGTAQTGGAADFYIANTPLASSIDGVRTEASAQVLDSTSPYLFLFSAFNLSNTFVRGEELERISGTGTCQWLTFSFGGAIRLSNVFIQQTPGLLGGGALAISAVGANTITVTSATVATLNEFVGAQVTIGVAAGSSITTPIQVAYVTGNTAGANTTLTLDTTFATDDTWNRTTPVAGTHSAIMRCSPRIRCDQGGGFFQRVIFDGVAAPAKVEDLIDPGAYTSWEGDYAELDSNENTVARGAIFDGTEYKRKRRTIYWDHGSVNDAAQSPNKYAFYHYLADVHKITANGDLTITLGGATDAGATTYPDLPRTGAKIRVLVYQDSTGSRTITWQTSTSYPLVWDQGESPPGSWEASGLRIFEFYADGTTWRGKMVYASSGTGPTALTYGTTISTDAALNDDFTINVTNNTAFTISNPTNAIIGDLLTYSIKNTSGGAMGAITWGSEFKMAGAFTNPANNTRRTITFHRETSTEWVERSRAAADIA